MTNHYIRQGATGNNTGENWTNAYTQLPSTLFRGDTYYIADGNYTGYTFDDANNGTIVITIKKATIADHGTSTGWSDSYGDGQGIFTSGLNFESSFWEFNGISGGGTGSWGSGYGFKVIETTSNIAVIIIGRDANVDNISVIHTELEGKGSLAGEGGSASNDGVAIYGNGWTYTPDNTFISYVWMHGIGRCPIWFAVGGANSVFEYIYVTSYFASDTYHAEVLSTSNMWGDVTFRNSLVTDIQGTGALMWDNQNNNNLHLYVYGNVFYRPSGAEWSGSNGVIGGWTGTGNNEDCFGMRIYNNVFININFTNEYKMVFTTFIAEGHYGNNIAYNNLFYDSLSPDYAMIATHDYNHYINSGGTHSETNGTSAVSGDPFTDYVGLDFTLIEATQTGIDVGYPYNIDPMGLVRGSDGIWDRGAYEYVSTQQCPTPIVSFNLNT